MWWLVTAVLVIAVLVAVGVVMDHLNASARTKALIGRSHQAMATLAADHVEKHGKEPPSEVEKTPLFEGLGSCGGAFAIATLLTLKAQIEEFEKRKQQFYTRWRDRMLKDDRYTEEDKAQWPEAVPDDFGGEEDPADTWMRHLPDGEKTHLNWMAIKRAKDALLHHQQLEEEHCAKGRLLSKGLISELQFNDLKDIITLIEDELALIRYESACLTGDPNKAIQMAVQIIIHDRQKRQQARFEAAKKEQEKRQALLQAQAEQKAKDREDAKRAKAQKLLLGSSE